jgi:rSAM/selenodomain-associated transferase 2
MSPLISIIIPVLNDDPALERCLLAFQMNSESEKLYEILVADGAPCEQRAKWVSDRGCRYVPCGRGRAVQLNTAAELARGKWIWFLHADCIPSPECVGAIINLNDATHATHATHATQWGCFRHRIADRALLLRIIERADNLRARFTAMPYGDQGIFVTADAFRKIGGFPAVPILEDVMLSRALRKLFGRPAVLSPIIFSDARRWRQHGIIATTLTNWRVLWMHFVQRAPTQAIAEYYAESSRSIGQSS